MDIMEYIELSPDQKAKLKPEERPHPDAVNAAYKKRSELKLQKEAAERTAKINEENQRIAEEQERLRPIRFKERFEKENPNVKFNDDGTLSFTLEYRLDPDTWHALDDLGKRRGLTFLQYCSQLSHIELNKYANRRVKRMDSNIR